MKHLECRLVRSDVRSEEGNGEVLCCDGENIIVRVPQEYEDAEHLISDIMNIFWENGIYTYRTDRSTPTMEEILSQELNYMKGKHADSYVYTNNDRSLMFTPNCITVIGYVCYHRGNVSQESYESALFSVKWMIERIFPES